MYAKHVLTIRAEYFEPEDPPIYFSTLKTKTLGGHRWRLDVLESDGDCVLFLYGHRDTDNGQRHHVRCGPEDLDPDVLAQVFRARRLLIDGQTEEVDA